MQKNKSGLLIVFCAAGVLAIVAAVVALWMILGGGNESSFDGMDPQGELVLKTIESERIQVSWSEGKNADGYLIEVISADSKETIYSAYSDGEPACEIPCLDDYGMVTIRINTVTLVPGDADGMRLGKTALEVSGVFLAPGQIQPQWGLNPNDKTLQISYQLEENCQAILYRVHADGTKTQEEILTGEEKTITYGQDIPVLEEMESDCFALAAMRRGPQYVFYGLSSETITVTGEQLLGTKLELNCTDHGENVFTFTWNETRGDYYELQRLDSANAGWITVCRVNKNEPRIYTAESLERYTNYRFRVVACWEDPTKSEEAAQPASVTVQTKASALYCTIWPQKDINVYSDAKRSAVLGQAKGAQAFCVLAVENGMFRVRWGEDYGYLDREYCLINLSEYMGDICRYNITNCYSSLYMVHGYEVNGVTGTQVYGYEKATLTENRFLVPLLYTSAQKLEKAALEAETYGYRLVVYDAFRAGKTEAYIYEKMMALLDQELPAKTYFGGEGDFPGMTYAQLITNNGYGEMADYLFRNGSPNTQGIAVDVTLEHMNTFKELPMQTMMHDQSWYSDTSRNTEGSNLLAEIMKNAGFTAQSAIWWNFVDMYAMEKLSVETPLWEAVGAECWMADAFGWKYRLENGVYCVDCTREIDGVVYTFDADGYVK